MNGDQRQKIFYAAQCETTHRLYQYIIKRLKVQYIIFNAYTNTKCDYLMRQFNQIKPSPDLHIQN